MSQPEATPESSSFPCHQRHNRRSFLVRTAAMVGTPALAGVFQSLLAHTARAAGGASDSGFGPLQPVKDDSTGLALLQLPDGFRYLSFGWSKDPMADGTPTPGSHDGMAVIAADGDVLTLCRNHEVTGSGRPFGPAEITYDPQSRGGCTNLAFDAKSGTWLSARPSLSGTMRNCAGGPTPWGTWLSCEETVFSPGDERNGVKLGHERTHGWIFEVPAEGQAAAQPLKDMGRFVHEAIAVDPQTGIVYETEDRGTAGFYRFVPRERGRLAQGGRLQMAQVVGREDVRRGCRTGQTFDIQWVDIEEPQRAHSLGEKDEQGVFRQGKAHGATTFARLEGCWYGDGTVYFDATSGGDAGSGQVWAYKPGQEQLTLIFESPGPDVLDKPDNLAVSPRGGLVLCEDGSTSPARLHGLTSSGRLIPLAANNIVLQGERNGVDSDFRGEEWAGATFSPDGQWLFVNIQSPGITFAITGPWAEGGL